MEIIFLFTFVKTAEILPTRNTATDAFRVDVSFLHFYNIWRYLWITH